MNEPDLKRYRIEGEYTGVDDLQDLLARVGVHLVPDDSLQQIASAWSLNEKSGIRLNSPRLAALLDGLVNDE